MKRIVGVKYIVAALLTGILLCPIPGAASSKTAYKTPVISSLTSTYTIYLRNSNGVYENASAYSSFQGGQVTDTRNGAIIGTVPAGSLYIYNASNQIIGYLDPEV